MQGAVSSWPWGCSALNAGGIGGQGGNFQLCTSGTTGWEERCRVNLVRLARIEQKCRPLRGDGV